MDGQEKNEKEGWYSEGVNEKKKDGAIGMDGDGKNEKQGRCS